MPDEVDDNASVVSSSQGKRLFTSPSYHLEEVAGRSLQAELDDIPGMPVLISWTLGAMPKVTPTMSSRVTPQATRRPHHKPVPNDWHLIHCHSEDIREVPTTRPGD